MPSSADRRRVEIPTYVFERVKEIAATEQRTIASVVNEILSAGVWGYKSVWTPADREKVGPRAKRVLELAERDEPRRFGHNYIGTEHLLLALLAEGGGVAAAVLRELGVDHATASRHLEVIVGRGDAPADMEREYVPRVRKVLGLALKAAVEPELFAGGRIGTGHLLLAIVREGEGIAAGILKRIGVDLERVAQDVTSALKSADKPLLDN